MPFVTKKLQKYLLICNLFVTFAQSNKDKEVIYTMKYNQFKTRLKAAGCSLVRQGGGHEVWYSPITGLTRPLPRHGSKEVPTGLLKSLEKDLLGL